jgi:hypothetical protein
MPQVMKRQSRQPGSVARSRVPAPERRVVDRITGRSAEHEVVWTGEPLAAADLVQRDERLAGQRDRTPLARLGARLEARGHRRHHDQRPVGEANTAPAQRAQLALPEPGQASHAVDRSVLDVRALLLDVLVGTRPTAAAVDVVAVARSASERENLLGRECLGRLRVVLAPLVGLANRVDRKRESER